MSVLSLRLVDTLQSRNYWVISISHFMLWDFHIKVYILPVILSRTKIQRVTHLYIEENKKLHTQNRSVTLITSDNYSNYIGL